MKKQIFTVAVLAATLLATSCTSYKAKEDVTLKNVNDSVSYAFGVSIGKSFQTRLANDSTVQKNDFYKAIDNGYKSEVGAMPMAEIQAYFQGTDFGKMVKQQSYFDRDSLLKINPKTIQKAARANLLGEKLDITTEQASMFSDSIFNLLSSDSLKASLKIDNALVEKLNYAIGISSAEQTKNYYLRNDSTKKQAKAYLKGLDKAISVKNENKELLGIGEQIGIQVKFLSKGAGVFGDSSVMANKTLVLQGIINALENADIVFAGTTPEEYLNATAQRLRSVKLAVQYSENKVAGEKFLQENKTKDGVKTTDSGLQYEIITEGKGKVPADTNTVSVLYKGTLIDGTEFDSSLDPKNPTVFHVTGVIKGWTEALKLMSVGSKWKIYVPQELAYGTADMGTIKPFSTLVFEIELLEVK